MRKQIHSLPALFPDHPESDHGERPGSFPIHFTSKATESGMENKRRKRIIRVKAGQIRLAGILLLLWVFALPFVRAKAEETSIPKAVEDAKAGIVRVKSVCSAGSKTLQERERTGFLVGKKESEPFVITTAAGLAFSEKEQKRLIQDNQLEENVQVSTRIVMIFQGDVQIPLSMIGKSEKKNLAVLRPEQSITDKYILEFPEDRAEKGMVVYLLSFPSYTDESDENYSKATVVPSKAKVLGRALEKTNNTQYFYHNVEGNDGILGAPFVDKDGMIIGMIVGASYEENPDGSERKDGRIALTNEEIMQFMELHNASYSEEESAVEVQKRRSRLPLILGSVTLLLAIVTLIRVFRMHNKERAASGRKGRKKSSIPEAGLLRLSTREMIRIESERFLIGSSAQKADYAVTGNRKVSRVHAAVICDRGKFYLEDMGSTNGTVVRGRRLDSGERVQLENGTEFSLADEKFVFRK